MRGSSSRASISLIETRSETFTFTIYQWKMLWAPFSSSRCGYIRLQPPARSRACSIMPCLVIVMYGCYKSSTKHMGILSIHYRTKIVESSGGWSVLQRMLDLCQRYWEDESTENIRYWPRTHWSPCGRHANTVPLTRKNKLVWKGVHPTKVWQASSTCSNCRKRKEFLLKTKHNPAFLGTLTDSDWIETGMSTRNLIHYRAWSAFAQF